MKLLLFFLNLIVPAIMIIGGWFLHRHPPKEINLAVGYRTRRSMKSIEAWRFANRKIGVLWKKTGLISLLATVAVQIPFLFQPADSLAVLSLILTTVQLALLLLSIIPVERALKKQFPDEK